MHDNIITQNIKLIDEKIIIEEIKGVKYLVYHVSREFEPTICK